MRILELLSRVMPKKNAHRSDKFYFENIQWFSTLSFFAIYFFENQHFKYNFKRAEALSPLELFRVQRFQTSWMRANSGLSTLDDVDGSTQAKKTPTKPHEDPDSPESTHIHGIYISRGLQFSYQLHQPQMSGGAQGRQRDFQEGTTMV